MGSDPLALYTAVYPGVEPYLSAWYRSVRSQTDAEFDLWISVDSLTVEEVLAVLGKDAKVNWLIAVKNDSPAAIRQKALQQIARQYAGIVLADSDDVLYPSRIQSAREVLKRYDVVGNAMRFVDKVGRDLDLTFVPRPDDDLQTLLPRKNIFGLSNTAYRSEQLLKCLPIPTNCVLIDWFIATRAWMNGASMHFDPIPHMAYRQHSRNTARVLPPFDANEVLKATQLVLSHYRHVLDNTEYADIPSRAAIQRAYSSVQLFYTTVTGSKGLLARYVTALNRLPPQYVWWWFVAHPDLEDIWNP